MSISVSEGRFYCDHLHVDDRIVFSNSDFHLSNLQHHMESSLRVKWFDNPDKIVGIKLEQSQGQIQLSQHLLIDQVLDKHDQEFKTTHINTYTPLMNSNPVTSKTSPVNPVAFQSYIGSLNYIALGSRPDLSFAVNFLARFSSNPDHSHWGALHHFIRYLRTTRNKKLLIQPNTFCLQTWSDASWGGKFHRSTSGFCTKLFGCPIAWGSRRQKTIAKLTHCAEYIALASAVDFHLFLTKIIRSILPDFKSQVFCDNRASVLVANDNGSKAGLRSLHRSFFFVNDSIRENNIDLQWVSTKENVADFLTKTLGAQQHHHLLSSFFH